MAEKRDNEDWCNYLKYVEAVSKNGEVGRNWREYKL